MMIYKQHFFRRKLRKMPSPSCLPIAVVFALLSMCLIVVMPSIITGIKVEMPKLNTQPLEIYDDFVYTTISIVDNDTIYVNNNLINKNEIGAVIKVLNNNVQNDNLQIFIRANQNVSYNTITETLQLLNNDGFNNITLVGKYINGIQNIQ